MNLKVIFGKRWDVQLVELNNLPWIFMEKIWYDPHEKSPRVDRILSKIWNDKEKISPIPDIWRLRKQKNQNFFPEIAIQLKIELFEPEDSNFEVNIPRKRVSS